MGIYRPRYTRRIGDRTVRGQLRKYYLEYRDPTTGARRRIPLSEDKRVARVMAGRILAEAEEGRINPYAAHDRRLLTEHLADYRAELVARAVHPRYQSMAVRHVEQAAAACSFQRLADLKTAPLRRYLTALRSRGRAPSTINHHLRDIKAFAHWLVRHGRLRADPFAEISTLNTAVGAKHPRRAARPEELTALIDAARVGPSYLGISGLDRAALYQTAYFTGFRRRALISLTPRSFDLTGTPPTVTVTAAHSKSGKTHTVPLHPAVCAMLSTYLQGRPAGEPIWAPGSWVVRTAIMLRRDLQAAGIPYQTAEGYLDFHALRASFITALARAGVHPKAAQQLAGHAKLDTTMRYYTRLGLDDLAADVARLPGLAHGADMGSGALPTVPGGSPSCADSPSTAAPAPRLERPIRPEERSG